MVTTGNNQWLSINSLAPGRCDSNLKLVILTLTYQGQLSYTFAVNLPSGEWHTTSPGHGWLINIGSGNGLERAGNKPFNEPYVDLDLCRQMASQDHIDLS